VAGERANSYKSGLSRTTENGFFPGDFAIEITHNAMFIDAPLRYASASGSKGKDLVALFSRQ